MITLTERLNNVESAMVSIYNQATKLATIDEIEAVRQTIFEDEIETLRSRLKAIEYNLDMLEKIISTATGN